MSRRRFNELIVAVVAIACTIAMWVVLWKFGHSSNYWGLLVPTLLLVFFVSWRSVSRTDGNRSVLPYSVFMALVSALVVLLDLGS